MALKSEGFVSEKSKYQVPISVHLPERNDAEVLTGSECGNALMDLLMIAVAKKQVSLLLAVVKQADLS